MEMPITILHQKLTNITIIVAYNLQQICSQTSNMTTNTTLGSICTLWLHQTTYISTNETLKQITYTTWNFLVYLFNKEYLLWFQGSTSYLKPDYVQQKWNQLNEDHKLTVTAGDIFSQFRSAGEIFFSNLVRLFHNDQFRPWVYVAARYLIAAVVFIICIRCLFVLLSCLWFIFSSFLMFILKIVCTIFGFLFLIIFFTFKACLEFVCVIFRFLRSVIIYCLNSVRIIFWFLKPLLCFGGKSTVKMMKAPGRPSMMIARAAFEANPLGYFAKLRGRL